MEFSLLKNRLYENALIYKYRIPREDLPLLKSTFKPDEVNSLIYERLTKYVVIAPLYDSDGKLFLKKEEQTHDMNHHSALIVNDMSSQEHEMRQELIKTKKETSNWKIHK